MPSLLTAGQLLDREYLEIRARLLDIASSLDRIEGGLELASARQDARFERLRHGLQLVAGGGPDRAERLQMLFSDAYDPSWRKPHGGGA